MAPIHKHSIFITSWDDGHPLDLRIASLLKKYDLNGTFFIPIENIEGREVLSRENIIELASTFEVGSHTYSHLYLNSIKSSVQANEEILNGKNELENILGKKVFGFCYPGGKFNSDIINMVSDSGFEYARTIENLRIDLGIAKFKIPTTIQFFPHSYKVLVRNYIKNPSIKKNRLVLKSLFSNSYLEYLLWLLDYSIQNQGIFHLWGHSWEIEKFNLWEDLECFFKEVSERKMSSLSIYQSLLTHGK